MSDFGDCYAKNASRIRLGSSDVYLRLIGMFPQLLSSSHDDDVWFVSVQSKSVKAELGMEFA